MRYLLNIPCLLALVTMAGCTMTTTETEKSEISGQAFYVERIAAPANARLEVVLEDISRAGADAVRIAKLTIEDAGQPPYPFTIQYDPADINPAHSYRVAARLYQGDEMLFISDQIHQVITRGFPSSVSVRMRQVQAAQEHPLGPLPATFFGTLPCADCPGIDIQLDLLTDGVYFLRETYRDREDGTFDDIGRYLLSSHQDQLSLHGGREAPKRFALSAEDSLTLLDLEGRKIQSELNYTLVRQAEYLPIEPRVLMHGAYRYLAGAGRFRECLTGLEMPVITEADNRVLEEAYLANRPGPGEVLMVNLDGRIEQREPMEGPGPVASLIPKRFIGVSAYDCPELLDLADLENTYWRLTLIENAYVQRAPDQREPHLVFHPDGRLTGSDGCNQLTGSYRIHDTTIEFSGLAIMQRACQSVMAQAETFRRILEQGSHYRIMGQHLEMRDEEDLLQLRFEAVALP